MRTAWAADILRAEIREMENPRIKDPQDVLIKIKTAGVCGSDIGLFNGSHPFRKPPAMFGHEMSGEILEVGSGVFGFKKGDRVAFNPIVNCGKPDCKFCNSDRGNICPDRQIAGANGSRIQGTFAEYIVVPYTHLSRLADHVTYDEGCLVEPMSVAVHAMKQFKGRRDSVLIYGTGVIGLFALLYAKKLGYKRIFCTNRGEYNRRLAMELGATAAFNPNEVNIKEVLKELEPDGINATVLSVANEQILSDVMAVTQAGGEICYVYQNTTPVPTNFCPLVNNEFSIFGVTGETMNDFQDAADYINENTETVRRLITHTYPMTKAGEAVAKMSDRSEPVIKVLVHPED